MWDLNDRDFSRMKITAKGVLGGVCHQNSGTQQSSAAALLAATWNKTITPMSRRIRRILELGEFGLHFMYFVMKVLPAESERYYHGTRLHACSKSVRILL